MCYSQFFLSKSTILGILFSTAVRAVLVAKLVMLGILFLTSFILALRASVVAKLVMLVVLFLISYILALRVVLIAELVISGILSSGFLIFPLYTGFLTTSFFTTLHSLLKSAPTGINLSKSNLSALLFKLLKLFFNLSISGLCTSDLKLAKSTFLANCDVTTPLQVLNPFLLHN